MKEMLGSLGENLTNTMKKLAGMSVIDKKTIKVCVPDTNGTCIEGEATSLTSSLCFELSGRTYSWNPSKNKCEKCVKSTKNN